MCLGKFASLIAELFQSCRLKECKWQRQSVCRCASSRNYWKLSLKKLIKQQQSIFVISNLAERKWHWMRSKDIEPSNISLDIPHFLSPHNHQISLDHKNLRIDSPQNLQTFESLKIQNFHQFKRSFNLLQSSIHSTLFPSTKWLKNSSQIPITLEFQHLHAQSLESDWQIIREMFLSTAHMFYIAEMREHQGRLHINTNFRNTMNSMSTNSVQNRNHYQ